MDQAPPKRATSRSALTLIATEVASHADDEPIRVDDAWAPPLPATGDVLPTDVHTNVDGAEAEPELDTGTQQPTTFNTGKWRDDEEARLCWALSTVGAPGGGGKVE
jgi:hypothetical protein